MVQKRNKEKSLKMEIILQLIKSENHVREIAKNLEESHVTISRKLNALQKENVVDFEQKGKNKIFKLKKNIIAKNYVFNAERYKLNQLVKKYAEMLIIADQIIKNTTEKLVLIFGSYAKFTSHEDSDIDVYIMNEDKKVKKKLEEIHSKIKVKLGKFNLNSELIKEIIKNHVILRGVEEFYERTKFFD